MSCLWTGISILSIKVSRKKKKIREVRQGAREESEEWAQADGSGRSLCWRPSVLTNTKVPQGGIKMIDRDHCGQVLWLPYCYACAFVWSQFRKTISTSAQPSSPNGRHGSLGLASTQTRFSPKVVLGGQTGRIN